jgi:hypothetical protein
MKKVLLICTNENHEIVSVDVCDTKEQAVELMRTQYETEMAEAGYVESATVESECAEIIVSEGEYEYYWEIKEIKL